MTRYREITGPGVMAQVRTRCRDTATWHDVAYLIGLWDPDSSTAYLINPATRTRTTLRLRGIPRAQYVTLA